MGDRFLRQPPRERQCPLDLASFYLHATKKSAMQVAPGIAATVDEQTWALLETILRDAGVSCMTGRELAEACEYYVASSALILQAPEILVRALWVDGLIHGIALSGGLTAEPPVRTGTAAS